MKKVMSVLVLCAASAAAFAQEYALNEGVSLDEFNAQTGVLMDFEEEVNLFSPWDRGRVVRYSNDESNATGFGRFVEIAYEAGFTFEGFFMAQGTFSVIFANVQTICVDQNVSIKSGDLICAPKKGEGNSLRVLIVSQREDLRFLEQWSGFSGIEHNGYWYWNPMFLFAGGD
jgi:hypothetical protein